MLNFCLTGLKINVARRNIFVVLAHVLNKQFARITGDSDRSCSRGGECVFTWGGGLVNMKAQATGYPVIASRVGGIPEYSLNNKNGILFEFGNYNELAEKISHVISDKKLREKIIEEGYKHSKLFDWNILAPQYVGKVIYV